MPEPETSPQPLDYDPDRHGCPLQWLRKAPRAQVLESLNICRTLAKESLAEAQVRQMVSEHYGSDMAAVRSRENVAKRKTAQSVLHAVSNIIEQRKI